MSVVLIQRCQNAGDTMVAVPECLSVAVRPCFSEGSGWLFSKTFFLAHSSCSLVHSTLSLYTTEPREEWVLGQT